MLNKIVLTLLLALGFTTQASAKNDLAESNLQVTWVAQNYVDAYALTGEYVASNNFFVGGGYAWANSAYGDSNALNVNVGSYFSLARFSGDRLYGKVGVGYTGVGTDYSDYSVVDGRIGLVYEGDAVRATVGTSAALADIVDGFGVVSYNFDGSLGWKFLETWETGAQFSLGDTDTYGLYVRYNFM